jgi:hypothetical protein
MYGKLIDVDPIREKYWTFLKDKAIGMGLKVDATD